MTVREIVEAALARIDALDQQGLALNAVIELNPDALVIADELEIELARAMRAVPCTAFRCYQGQHRHRRRHSNHGRVPGGEGAARHLDASLVTFLREPGVVILRKTNLSEGPTSDRSSPPAAGADAWTDAQPYQIDRIPGRVRAGAAAPAGYVSVTIGTETNGSIVSPARNSGVDGMKPTVGLVSASDDAHLDSQDTVARSRPRSPTRQPC